MTSGIINYIKANFSVISTYYMGDLVWELGRVEMMDRTGSTLAARGSVCEQTFR